MKLEISTMITYICKKSKKDKHTFTIVLKVCCQTTGNNHLFLTCCIAIDRTSLVSKSCKYTHCKKVKPYRYTHPTTIPNALVQNLSLICWPATELKPRPFFKAHKCILHSGMLTVCPRHTHQATEMEATHTILQHSEKNAYCFNVSILGVVVIWT